MFEGRHPARLLAALCALGLVSAAGAALGSPTPPAVPVAAGGSFPLSSYRIFVEGVTFGGTDAGYSAAEYLFKARQKSDEAWAAPQPILIGPGYKAKDLPLRSRKPVSYGLSYFFPVQMSDAQQLRIEGEL